MNVISLILKHLTRLSVDVQLTLSVNKWWNLERREDSQNSPRERRSYVQQWAKQKVFFFVSCSTESWLTVTRCKGRSGDRKLVEFDEFVGKKGSRPGANTTHGGEWRGGLSSHHANKRAPGVGLRERRGEELSGGT